MTTTTIQSSATTLRAPGVEFEVDDAGIAAVSFLARYSGRTLEAYRHDLRGFFQWATEHGIAVLVASRAHIELFRAWMEGRGLAAATIDRRLSTVCGFYRFAHIDGRIRSNPAQYVRRPQVHASDTRGLDRSELGVFLFTAEHYDRDHAALAVLLGLTGCESARPVPPTSRTSASSAAIAHCGSWARATSPPPCLSCPGPPGRSTWPSVNVTRGRSCDAVTVNGSTDAPPTGGSAQSGSGPGSAPCIHTCCEPRSSWPHSTPASRCETSTSPPATPTPAPQPSTTDDARTSTATPRTLWSPSSQAADLEPPTPSGTPAARPTGIAGTIIEWLFPRPRVG
jgi:Phage integrase, N-terminal SAM-like domain